MLFAASLMVVNLYSLLLLVTPIKSYFTPLIWSTNLSKEVRQEIHPLPVPPGAATHMKGLPAKLFFSPFVASHLLSLSINAFK